MDQNDFVAQLQVTFSQQFHKNQSNQCLSQIGPWTNKPEKNRLFFKSTKQDQKNCKSLPLKKQDNSRASLPIGNRNLLKRKIRCQTSCQTSCQSKHKLPRLLRAMTPQVIEVHSVDKIRSQKQMRFPFITKKKQRDSNILNFLNKKKQECINKKKYFFREVNLMLKNYLQKGHEYALNVAIGNLNRIVVPLQVKF